MTTKRLLLALLVTVTALYGPPARSQTVPKVRIGLTQNAATVSLRSSDDFTIQQNRTRTAKFSIIVTVDSSLSNRVLTKNDLQYRVLVEIDGGKILVVPKTEIVKVESKGNSFIEVDNHTYRGTIEVFGNSRNSLTVVNE